MGNSQIKAILFVATTLVGFGFKLALDGYQTLKSSEGVSSPIQTVSSALEERIRETIKTELQARDKRQEELRIIRDKREEEFRREVRADMRSLQSALISSK